MNRIMIKLFFTYLLIILITSGIIAIIIEVNFENYYKEKVIADIDKEAFLLTEIYNDYFTTYNIEEVKSKCSHLGNKLNHRLTIIDKTGKVIADTSANPMEMENHLFREEIQQALKENVGKVFRYSQTLRYEMLYYAVPIKINGKPEAFIRIAIPLQDYKSQLSSFQYIIIFSSIIGLITTLILSFFISNKITKPLISIKKITERIIDGDFSNQLRIKTKDEIGQLSESINKMSYELKSKLSEIETKKNELQAIIESMIEGLLFINDSELITVANPTVLQMLNLRSNQIIGKKYWEVIGNEEINTLIKDTLMKTSPIKKEVVIFYPQEKHFNVQTSIIKNDLINRIDGIICVFHDITSLKNIEKFKSEFLADASHELKTPLTLIGGFVETLQDENLLVDENSKKFFNIIISNIKRMDVLIDDLLNLSKLESGYIQLNFLNFNIEDLIIDIINKFSEKAKQKNISIIYTLNNIADIYADDEKLEIVISNLLDNAIKYSNTNDQIQIIVSYTIDNFYKIEVRDNGIGILPEHIPYVFDRFYRVDKARSRELGGTGLGLAIVKKIIEMHSGKVEVVSDYNKGSNFIIYLPIVSVH